VSFLILSCPLPFVLSGLHVSILTHISKLVKSSFITMIKPYHCPESHHMEFSIKFSTEHHNFFKRINIVLERRGHVWKGMVRSVALKFFECIVEDAIASCMFRILGWGTKFLIWCIYLLFFSLTKRLSCRQFSYMLSIRYLYSGWFSNNRKWENKILHVEQLQMKSPLPCQRTPGSHGKTTRRN